MLSYFLNAVSICSSAMHSRMVYLQLSITTPLLDLICSLCVSSVTAPLKSFVPVPARSITSPHPYSFLFYITSVHPPLSLLRSCACALYYISQSLFFSVHYHLCPPLLFPLSRSFVLSLFVSLLFYFLFSHHPSFLLLSLFLLSALLLLLSTNHKNCICFYDDARRGRCFNDDRRRSQCLRRLSSVPKRSHCWSTYKTHTTCRKRLTLDLNHDIFQQNVIAYHLISYFVQFNNISFTLFYSIVRQLRRGGRIGEFVSVYLNPEQKAVYIASDGGRVCRPLLVLEEGEGGALCMCNTLTAYDVNDTA